MLTGPRFYKRRVEARRKFQQATMKKDEALYQQLHLGALVIHLDEDLKKPKGLYHAEELMRIVYEVAKAIHSTQGLSLEEAAAIEPTVWTAPFIGGLLCNALTST